MTTPANTLPGAYFDVPGVPGGSTQWTNQDDTTVNLSTTISSSTQVPITGIQQFKQTDVVSNWFLCLAVAQTYTAGTSTLTKSAYAPYNVLGPCKLPIQNQYASVDVESGIDLAIFNMIRPFAKPEILNGVNNYANPAGDPIGGTATGYLTTALAQANQINAAQWATTTTEYSLMLRLPAAQWFDSYWDLAVTGEPVANPHPALVSPQYMAGTTRVITPQLWLNPGSTAVTDGGPVNIGSGTGTFSGSSILRLRRRSNYAGSVQTSPPVYAWQYAWKTQRFNISGQSRFDLLVPLDAGQVLSVYVRLFDPAASSGLGAPIDISTITRVNLQYGSGLYWFDAETVGNINAAALVQQEWFGKHSTMLPPGVVAFDLAMDERGQLTNARALNTLTTAGVLVHMEFSSALSSSAYAVMGIESLVYVT